MVARYEVVFFFVVAAMDDGIGGGSNGGKGECKCVQSKLNE